MYNFNLSFVSHENVFNNPNYCKATHLSPCLGPHPAVFQGNDLRFRCRDSVSPTMPLRASLKVTVNVRTNTGITHLSLDHRECLGSPQSDG